MVIERGHGQSITGATESGSQQRSALPRCELTNESCGMTNTRYRAQSVRERFGLQFRGEFYNIFNHHNQYITSGNLDVSSLTSQSATAPVFFIQTEKGGPSGSAGTASDERRNIQLGLRLTF
jgi:hypothetical protein